MWRKRRSALFFDFENIPTKVSPDNVAALVAWLEDGRFDEAGGKRKLVSKRIYWNSAAERHRETFEAAGFDVVLCEKFSSMKNGADIRMALDIVDSCWTLPDIKEYILFTTDSDFVPVLQRLTEKSKTSAILVNEAKMDSHTAFKIFADVLVPTRQLGEALTYKRPNTGLLGALRKSSPRRGSSAATQTAAKDDSPGSSRQDRKSIKPDHEDPMVQAERAVLRVAGRTPKKFVPRRTIERQLDQIKDFRKTGANAYLGEHHYQGLMLAIGKRNKRIKVTPGRSESASVMYVPGE
jgi:NYN domain